ncbi:MAG: hypothetical protein ABI747_00730 [Candidatus Moraniibacteriota bacterium]
MVKILEARHATKPVITKSGRQDKHWLSVLKLILDQPISGRGFHETLKASLRRFNQCKLTETDGWCLAVNGTPEHGVIWLARTQASTIPELQSVCNSIACTLDTRNIDQLVTMTGDGDLWLPSEILPLNPSKSIPATIGSNGKRSHPTNPRRREYRNHL